MQYLSAFACFGFAVQSLLGILTLSIAPSMVATRLHQGPLFVAITLLAGTLLFVSLNLLPAIAWWTLRKGKPSARGWAIAASLINLAWVPLVASCTESGAMLLALLGVCGLVAFWARPRPRQPVPANNLASSPPCS
jgi:hypothetical protein